MTSFFNSLRARFRSPLLSVYATLALLSLSWVFLLPPFQGSDESVHFGQSKLWFYTVLQSLDEEIDPSTACQEDLSYLLREHRVPTLRFNPLSSYGAPLLEYPRHYQFLNDHGCVATGPFYVYYLYNLPFLFLTSPFNLTVQFYALRLAAWLLFCVHLGVAHRIGRLLFDRPLFQLFLPLALGLHPLFVASHTWVSYDGLLNLLFSLNVWVALSFMLQKSPFMRMGRFLGASTLFAALAVTTKLSGVATLLPTLAGLLLVQGLSKRHTWALWSGFFGVSSLFSFQFLKSAVPTFKSALETFWETPESALFQLLVQRPWVVFESFWGGWGFGWMDTYAPPFFIVVFALFTIVGFLGALRTVFRSRVVLFNLLVLAGFEMLAIAYNILYPPVALIETGFVQGRYYYPLIVPFFLMLFYGWQALEKRPITRLSWISGVFLGLLLVYHLIYLNVIVIPRYYF